MEEDEAEQGREGRGEPHLGHGLLGDRAGPALPRVHALLHGKAAPVRLEPLHQQVIDGSKVVVALVLQGLRKRSTASVAAARWVLSFVFCHEKEGIWGGFRRWWGRQMLCSAEKGSKQSGRDRKTSILELW